MDNVNDFKRCILCGLHFPVRMSADISQCWACHRFLNRLFIKGNAVLAREAWSHYKVAVDAIRGENEPKPEHWDKPFMETYG